MLATREDHLTPGSNGRYRAACVVLGYFMGGDQGVINYVILQKSDSRACALNVVDHAMAGTSMRAWTRRPCRKRTAPPLVDPLGGLKKTRLRGVMVSADLSPIVL